MVVRMTRLSRGALKVMCGEGLGGAHDPAVRGGCSRYLMCVITTLAVATLAVITLGDVAATERTLCEWLA